MILYIFFKQNTAYELRISDWSSDVCSSDLRGARLQIRLLGCHVVQRRHGYRHCVLWRGRTHYALCSTARCRAPVCAGGARRHGHYLLPLGRPRLGYLRGAWLGPGLFWVSAQSAARSEEHTSELQSLMRISYAVFCLKKTIR